ncbi:hypothetical protein DL769_010385 [Monosporascus sp. CRB-8-3]|nr:hypothetical protein DL769_010385 [Monosporascus sp. CRB-8-3]
MTLIADHALVDVLKKRYANGKDTIYDGKRMERDGRERDMNALLDWRADSEAAADGGLKHASGPSGKETSTIDLSGKSLQRNGSTISLPSSSEISEVDEGVDEEDDIPPIDGEWRHTAGGLLVCLEHDFQNTQRYAEYAHKTLHGRVFFVTKKGYIGIAPKDSTWVTLRSMTALRRLEYSSKASFRRWMSQKSNWTEQLGEELEWHLLTQTEIERALKATEGKKAPGIGGLAMLL